MSVVNNFNCRGFGPLLEDKLCLIFKLAPSVCRMTFPILASLLVRLVVLLPFQLLRLSLATPSRWTPLALSRSEERRVGKECRSRGSPYHYKKKNCRTRPHRHSIQCGTDSLPCDASAHQGSLLRPRGFYYNNTPTPGQTPRVTSVTPTRPPSHP